MVVILNSSVLPADEHLVADDVLDLGDEGLVEGVVDVGDVLEDIRSCSTSSSFFALSPCTSLSRASILSMILIITILSNLRAKVLIFLDKSTKETKKISVLMFLCLK